jgi:hypothetical protein
VTGPVPAAGREWWRDQAARLAAEFGVTVRWCSLGFEIPAPGGGIRHISTPAEVRAILGGELRAAYDGGLSLRGCMVRFGLPRSRVERALREAGAMLRPPGPVPRGGGRQ